jgi:sulfur-carrier protein
MAIVIEVPTPLRKFTGGAKRATVEADTVGAALQGWSAGNHPLQARLFEGEALRADLRVFVGGNDIRTLQGLGTPLTEGQTVSIVPPVAGA